MKWDNIIDTLSELDEGDTFIAVGEGDSSFDGYTIFRVAGGEFEVEDITYRETRKLVSVSYNNVWLPGPTLDDKTKVIKINLRE